MSKHHCQVSFLFESLSLSLSDSFRFEVYLHHKRPECLPQDHHHTPHRWGRHESVDSETHSETRKNRKDDIVQVWKQKGKPHQELLKSDTTNNPINEKIRRTTEVNYCWVHPSLSNVVCVFNFKYGCPSPQNLKVQFNHWTGQKDVDYWPLVETTRRYQIHYTGVYRKSHHWFDVSLTNPNQGIWQWHSLFSSLLC